MHFQYILAKIGICVFLKLILQRMKFCTSILAIFLLTISLLPCNDERTCVDAKHKKTEQNHNQETNDLCSPFCFCACCGNMAFSFELFSYKLEKCFSIESKLSFTNSNSHLPTCYISIWQPPKIS